MGLKDKFGIIKKLYFQIQLHEITALGAQVTYYLILSFFPFLIFMVTLISYTKVSSMESVAVLSSILPKSVYALIVDVLQNVFTYRNKSLLPIGIVATLWSASTGVLAFMVGINKAYSQKETRPFWKIRIMSILFTLGFSMIILISILLVVFGTMMREYLFNVLGFPHNFKYLWDVMRYVISLITMMTIFILLYFYTPNCMLRLKNVIPGAILSTIVWIILSIGFAFYVNNFANFSYTYGSIGAIIALLIWLYWSSVIVLVGNELNAMLSKDSIKTCK